MIFDLLQKNDLLVIGRGFLLLAAIITIGVGMVQHQLTTLTQKNDSANFFSLSISFPVYSPVSFSRDNNYRYSVNFFGIGGEFLYCYRLGEAGFSGGYLTFKTTGHEFRVPAYFKFNINLEQIKNVIRPLPEQFREFAYKAKTWVNDILKRK